MTHAFSWVHVSDLHFGHGSAAHRVDQSAVLSELVDDVVASAKRLALTIDVVLVSGDIAFSAAPEQYAQARGWFEKMLDRLKTSSRAPELLAVAGNHDVQWSVARKYPLEDLVSSVRLGTRHIDDMLRHPDQLGDLRMAFANFGAFLRGADPIAWEKQFPLGSRTVHIVGLNTALLSRDGEDHGNLALAMAQLDQVARRSDDVISAVMTHHPITGGWLNNQSRVASWFARRADLHFCGHVHDADVNAVLRGSSGLHTIAAGASHGEASEGPSHAYSLGTLVSDEAGIRLRVFPRRWTDRHQKFALDVNVSPDGDFVEHELRGRSKARSTSDSGVSPPVAPLPIDRAIDYLSRGAAHERQSEFKEAEQCYTGAYAAATDDAGRWKASIAGARLELIRLNLSDAKRHLDQIAVGSGSPPAAVAAEYWLLRARHDRLNDQKASAKELLSKVDAGSDARLRGDLAFEQAELTPEENGGRVKKRMAFETAIQHYEQISDSVSIARTLLGVALTHDDTEQAILIVRKALKRFGDVGYRRGLSDGHARLARLYGHLEKFHTARDEAFAADTIAKTIVDEYCQAQAQMEIAFAALALGDLAEAEDAARAALVKRDDRPLLRGHAELLLGITAAWRDEFEKAAGHFAEASARYKTADKPRNVLDAAIWQADVAIDLGDAKAAREHLEKSPAPDNSELHELCKLVQARLLLLEGKKDQALVALNALDGAEQKKVRLEAIIYRARELFDRNQTAAIDGLLGEARTLVAQLENKYWTARFGELEAQNCEVKNRTEDAIRKWDALDVSWTVLGNKRGATRCRQRASSLRSGGAASSLPPTTPPAPVPPSPAAPPASEPGPGKPRRFVRRYKWPLVCVVVAFIAYFAGELDRSDVKALHFTDPEYSTGSELINEGIGWNKQLDQWLPMAELPKIADRDSRFDDWSPVVRFVHVSDFQFRDFGVKYFRNDTQARVVDRGAPEARRLAELDKNDENPTVALVGGIARITPPPSFVIHTGDAIDSGTVGELSRFAAVLDRLPIPWFSVVGNHDVFLMGNFTHAWLRLDNPPSEGVPLIGNRDLFMRLHGPGAPFPAVMESHASTVGGNAIVPGGSHLHGFDFGDYVYDLQKPREQPSASYSFPLYTEPPIRFIVLDTTKTDEQIPSIGGTQLPTGHAGSLPEDRRKWLERQLNEAKVQGEYVIIAGHHPLRELGRTRAGGESFANWLRDQRHVLAYLGGHTHEFEVHKHVRNSLDVSDGAEQKILPEIISTATRVDPPYGLLIEVLRKGDRLAVSYRSVVPRAKGELNALLRDFCQGAAKDAKKPMRCDETKSGAFTVATGVEDGPRKRAGWDAAVEPWRLLSQEDDDLGPVHGPGSDDPYKCLGDDRIKTRTTIRMRNEYDRPADIRFTIGHPDADVVHSATTLLPPGASLAEDKPLSDAPDTSIPVTEQVLVDVGRQVRVANVPGRAELTYVLEVCAREALHPKVTAP